MTSMRTVAPTLLTSMTLLTTMVEPSPTFPRKRSRRSKMLSMTANGGGTITQGQPT